MDIGNIQQHPEFIPTLQASPLFHQRPGHEIYAFLQQAQTLYRRYKKGEYIALFGEPMEGIGILLQGSALLTRENVQGHRSIVVTLTTASMFGEALLFTKHPTWPATIQATEATTVLFIPFQTFTQTIPGSEALQTALLVNLLQDLSEKTIILNRKLHYLTLKSMRERIWAYCSDLALAQQTREHIHIPHTRQEMADVLNVSRPSMCRELGRMADDGLLQLNGRLLTLLVDELD